MREITISGRKVGDGRLLRESSKTHIFDTACSANPPATVVDIRICAIVWVAFRAMCFSDVCCRCASAAKEIFALRYLFKMMWVAARMNTTTMIQYLVRGYRATFAFVHHTMYEKSSAIYSRSSISVTVKQPCPYPASTVPVFYYAGLKSFCNITYRFAAANIKRVAVCKVARVMLYTKAASMHEAIASRYGADVFLPRQNFILTN